MNSDDVLNKIYSVIAGWKQMQYEKEKYTDNQLRLVAEVALERISKIVENDVKA